MIGISRLSNNCAAHCVVQCSAVVPHQIMLQQRVLHECCTSQCYIALYCTYSTTDTTENHSSLHDSRVKLIKHQTDHSRVSFPRTTHLLSFIIAGLLHQKVPYHRVTRSDTAPDSCIFAALCQNAVKVCHLRPCFV